MFRWDGIKKLLANAWTWTGQQTFSNINVTGGAMTGVVISAAPFTTSTNPAVSAAVTTVIVDAYNGVTITLTGAGNAQTIGDPTITAAGKSFTVINNDTSNHSIIVNGITIIAGKSQSWVWDGTVWVQIDLGITSLPVPVNQGGSGQITASAAMNAFGVPSATAESDFIVAGTTPFAWAKKTLAEVKTILGLGSAAYTAATAYVTHALATAENDFLVASGNGAFVKKTLAQVLAIIMPSPGAIGETTPNTIRGLNKEVYITSSGSLSAAQCSGTIVSNYGMTDADCLVDLPTAVEGLAFVCTLPAIRARYFRLKCPTAQADKINLLTASDWVAGSDDGYVGVASGYSGNDSINVYTAKVTDGGFEWFMIPVSGSWVAG